MSVVPYFYECYLHLVKSVEVNNRKVDAHSHNSMSASASQTIEN